MQDFPKMFRNEKIDPMKTQLSLIMNKSLVEKSIQGSQLNIEHGNFLKHRVSMYNLDVWISKKLLEQVNFANLSKVSMVKKG